MQEFLHPIEVDVNNISHLHLGFEDPRLGYFQSINTRSLSNGKTIVSRGTLGKDGVDSYTVLDLVFVVIEDKKVKYRVTNVKEFGEYEDASRFEYELRMERYLGEGKRDPSRTDTALPSGGQ